MSDWNPTLYRKFEKERTQPAKDLVARIELKNPARIIDIGCGPGNSTKELLSRWGDAFVCGLDSSPNMLEQANAEMPDIQWILGDASGDLTNLGTFDLVFSNAALQWMPEHQTLLPRLFSILNEHGALAIQIPNTANMAITKALKAVTQSMRWSAFFRSVKQPACLEPGEYYNMLCRHTGEITLWETEYCHVMDSPSAIADWYESTGLRPYLNALTSPALVADFKADFLTQVKLHYPKQADGRVLFPFRRIFMLAYK